MYAIQGLNGKSFWDRAGSHICGRKPEQEQTSVEKKETYLSIETNTELT